MNRKNAVVTVNFGRFLCDNARASIQAAAERWGADYHELTEADFPTTVTHNYAKLDLFNQIEADRAVLIDGDMAVRFDAPSLFDHCPEDRLGVVSNINPRLRHQPELLLKIEHDIDLLNERLGLRRQYPGWYFNNGLVVLSRRHHQVLLEKAMAVIREFNPPVIYEEQAILNYWASDMGIDLEQLDETWNFIQPEDIGHWRFMERYVYHFTNSSESDRYSVLPRLNWRTLEPDPDFDRSIAFQARHLRVPDEGLRVNGHIVFSARQKYELVLKENLICFGPYCTVEPGGYRLTIEAELIKSELRGDDPPPFSAKLTSDYHDQVWAEFSADDMGRTAEGWSIRMDIPERLFNVELILYWNRSPHQVVVRGWRMDAEE